MTTRYATIGVFGLSFLISATSPFVETARAQMPLSCNQEIARQEAALDQFAIDARRESIDFVLDDARRSALSGVRARLAGNRTSQALEGIRQRWEDWNGFIEQGRTLQAIMAQISQCLAAGAGVCLNELIERNREGARLLDRVAEATNAYIESLGNETISNAAARVERARGVLQNLTTRAGNLATGALSGAMQNCFGDFERGVEAGGDPVDTASVQPQPQPQPPTQPPAPPVDLGGDRGDESAEAGGVNPAVQLAVLGGTGFGTWYVLDKSGVLDNIGGGGGSCTSTRNCVVNSFSGGCQCSGTTNGPCDFSGTPGGVGASCVGGVPCRSGLQCTNGRCEAPPGRCR